MVNREIADRQRELNRWTARYLRGVAPLVVDGKTGRLTNSRILATKYYLGYGERSSQWNAPFVRKLRHPHDPRYSPPWQLALGAKRRRAQRRTVRPRRTARSGCRPPSPGTPRSIARR